MNIFVLDSDPNAAAWLLCDQHVGKMLLEACQMLSTVSARFGGPAPYQPTHKNHPCTLWVGESYDDWRWLVEHAWELVLVHEHVFGTRHASMEVLAFLEKSGAHSPVDGLTPFAQAMPDHLRRPGDAVGAYREYYGYKRFAAYRNRERPPWLTTVRGGNILAPQRPANGLSRPF